MDFVNRVEWNLASPDLPDIGKEIEETLVKSKNVPSQDVIRAHEKLLFLVLQKLSAPGTKRLTRPELVVHLLADAEFSANPSLMGIIRALLTKESQLALLSEQLQVISTAVAGKLENNVTRTSLDVSLPTVSVTVPPLIVSGSKRVSNVNNFLKARSQVTWMAIRGESGAGKTQLAILLANQIKYPVWVDLRDSTQDQMVTLLDTCLLIASSVPRGPELSAWYASVCNALPPETTVFVDDVPPDGQSALAKRLLLLAKCATGKPITILTTSWDAINPSPAEYLGGEYLEILAPPFDDEEIREYCANHQAPQHLLADGGFLRLAGAVTRRHPQIVAALVYYMKRNSWTYDARVVNQLIRGDFADDIKLQTQRILNKTLPEPTRELLYRLNVIGPAITYDDVVRVSQVPPPISVPIDKLTDCVGIWVQRLSAEQFVLSALVQQLGSSNIPPKSQWVIHEQKAHAILASKAINQVEAYSSIIHLEKAGCAKEAAGVLLAALTSLSSQQGSAVEDFGLLDLWAHSDIPEEVPREIQIVIRSQQIRARIKHGKPYLTLLKRFDSLIELCTPKDELSVFVSCALLAVTFADKDYRRTISYSIKAFELEASVKTLLPDTPMNLSELMWVASPLLHEPEDLANYLEIIEKLPKHRQTQIFETQLAAESARFICDRYWMREEDKPNRDWKTLDFQLQALLKKSKELKAHTLTAALARARIVVAVEHYKNVKMGISVAEDAIRATKGNNNSDFLISFSLGVACSSIKEWPYANTWLTRAIDVYNTTSKFSDFFVRAHLSRATVQFQLGNSGESDCRKAVEYGQKMDSVSDLMLIRALGEYSVALWSSGKSEEFFDMWQQTIERTLAAKTGSRDWKEIFVINGNNAAFFIADPKLQESPAEMTRPFRGMYLAYSPLLSSRFEPDTEWFMPATMAYLAEQYGRYKESSRWALQAVDAASMSPLGADAKFLLIYAVSEAIREHRYVEAIEFAHESAQGAQRRDNSAVASWAKSHDREHLEKLSQERKAPTSSINEELLSVTIVPVVLDLICLKISDELAAQNAAEGIVRKCRELASQSTAPDVWSNAADRLNAIISNATPEMLLRQAQSDTTTGFNLGVAMCYLGIAHPERPAQTCNNWLGVAEWFQTRFLRSTLHVRLTAELLTRFWRISLIASPIAFRQPNTLTHKLNMLDKSGNYLPSQVMRHIVFHLGLQPPARLQQWLESN